MIKKQIINSGGFFLITFCSVITHTLLPIPPTLVFWLLSFLISILYFFLNNRRIARINSISLVPILFSIYLFFSQLLIGVDFRALVGPFMAPLYFGLTIFYLDLLDKNKTTKYITNFIYLSTVVFIIESIWRVLHPVVPDEEVLQSDSYQWFYVFKGPGLMYIETNGLAIHIIVVTFFAYWWGEFIGKKFYILKIILVTVLCLTFSRAAFFSFLIGIIYFYIIRKMNSIYFYLASLVLSFILIIVLPYGIELLQGDASTNSKFGLVDEVFKFYSNADLLRILFGIGNYNSINALGMYAHNYFLVYLIEMGIFGLTLLLFQFVYFVYISKKEILVILIPFLVQVMSSSTIFIPHFYMISAIFCFFSQKKLSGYKKVLI